MKIIIAPLAAFGAAFAVYHATKGADSGLSGIFTLIAGVVVFGLAMTLLDGDD